jgi:hypothetical protein
MRSGFFAALLFASVFLAPAAQAQSPHYYYLPQVANGNFGGGRYKTTFVLYNNTNTSTVATIDLTDANGNPLSMTITVLGEKNSTPHSGSNHGGFMLAGAIWLWQTDGQGELAVGAAKVTSTDADISISAIFSIYDPTGNFLTESGVGSTVPQSDFVFPVDTTGYSNTGMALFNIGNGDATLTATLRDTSGQAVATVSDYPLKNGAHIPIFVSGEGQLFPSFTDFLGTISIRSSVPIAAMVLRMHQDDTRLSYTSLPVVPSSSSATTLNLAQVANGGGYKTAFLIFNISTSPATVNVSLTNDSGGPLSMNIVGYGTDSSFSFPGLAPGASLFLQTDGIPESVSTGAATITSNVPIGACGVFTVLNDGEFQTETGVGASPVLTVFTLPVDINATSDTAIALFNAGSDTASLTFQRRDHEASGNLFGVSVIRDLPAGSHLPIFISEIFPGAGNWIGTVEVTATSGVAAMVLRMNHAPLSYTTLPVAPGSRTSDTHDTSSTWLPKTDSIATVTSNVVLDETIASGYKLTGTVRGPGTATYVYATEGTGIYSGIVDQAGRYKIVLPGGTNNLSVKFTPDGVPQTSPPNKLAITSPVGTVQVSGDTTRDITMPSVTLFDVSGTVHTTGTLPSTIFLGETSFTSSDGSVVGTPGRSIQGFALPAGSYTVAVLGFGTTPYSYGLHIGQGTVNITGTTSGLSFTAPELVGLSGTINNNAGTSPYRIVVRASTADSSVTCGETVNLQRVGPKYQMLLPKGLTYGVDVEMTFTDGTSMTFSGSSVTLNDDTADFDLTVPTLPEQVTISGRVTDGSGNPLQDVSVKAQSSSLTGVPNVSFTNYARTDANGNYSLPVPSGTNYQLTFVPYNK